MPPRRWRRDQASLPAGAPAPAVPAAPAAPAALGAPRPAPGPGEDMTPARLSERWAATGPSGVVEFYGHGASMGNLACFSNFYDQSAEPFAFEVPLEFCALELSPEERVVPCEFSEKAIMLCKAAAMGDRETYLKIGAARNPAKAKALGRQVQNFMEEVWNRIVCSVAFHVVYQKFRQSPGLQSNLLRTGDRLIAEATKNDRNWGIGIDRGDPRARDPRQWNGRNILGWALMEARAVLLRGVLEPDAATVPEAAAGAEATEPLAEPAGGSRPA